MSEPILRERGQDADLVHHRRFLLRDAEKVVSPHEAISAVELPQMMVEVLICHDGPLDRAHGPEKAVRVCRTLFWTSG